MLNNVRLVALYQNVCTMRYQVPRTVPALIRAFPVALRNTLVLHKPGHIFISCILRFSRDSSYLRSCVLQGKVEQPLLAKQMKHKESGGKQVPQEAKSIKEALP